MGTLRSNCSYHCRSARAIDISTWEPRLGVLLCLDLYRWGGSKTRLTKSAIYRREDLAGFSSFACDFCCARDAYQWGGNKSGDPNLLYIDTETYMADIFVRPSVLFVFWVHFTGTVSVLSYGS